MNINFDMESTISADVKESLPSYDGLDLRVFNKENTPIVNKNKDSNNSTQDRLPSYNSDLIIRHE